MKFRHLALLVVMLVGFPSFAATADLSVALSVSPPINLDNNGRMTWTAIVKNLGPDSATRTLLIVTLPPSNDVVPISVTPSERCSFRPEGGVVTCSLRTLVNSESVTVTIVGHPAIAGAKTVTASTFAAETDPRTTNNTQTVTTSTKEVAIADLRITLADAPDPAAAFDFLTYTLTITNVGDDDAADVVASLVVPPGSRIALAISDRGPCTLSGQTVTCVLGDFAVRSGSTVTVETVPSGEGFLYATASVAQSRLDPDPSNNAATVRTWVDGNPHRSRAVAKD